MAVVKGVCCVSVAFIFVCCFVSILLAVQPDGGSIDGLQDKEAYHAHKRSANVTNKKAIEAQKKMISKGAGSLHKILGKPTVVIRNATKDIITPSTTESLDNFTSATSLPEEQYNTSASTLSELSTLPSAFMTNVTTTSSTTVPISSSDGSASSSTTTTITTTTASPLSTGSTSEVLPTRPPYIKNVTEDYHLYYNSSLILEEKKAMSYHVDFDKLPEDKVVVHRMLSDSHRRAATVMLSFDFPFYGNLIRNITIATGGFLYMGDYMHSWLAATQYVAPLMANFDTSLSNESTVRYFDNGTAFVIEWNDVSLQERNIGEKFTFQAILLKSGDIVFVYVNIPVSVTEIGDASHPVKVGLSDAYVIDRVIYFIRRKTIYEYHRIDMKRGEISNHTAIYFTALTTCLSFKDCQSCMEANINLDCVWCDSVQRCSDGLDRKRQDWLQQRCDVERSKVECGLKSSPNSWPFIQPLADTSLKTYTTITTDSSNDILQQPSAPAQQPAVKPGHAASFDDEISQSAQVDVRQGNFSIGGVVAVLLLVALLLGTLAWVGYAYRNPHTSSGQLLIKYRPSQWRFRSGEARYTAASVHM